MWFMSADAVSAYMPKIAGACRKGLGESTMSEKETASKNPAAVQLGKLGGEKGGPARANSLSATERKEIALKGANSRWQGKPTSDWMKIPMH
jgi:hypothetical protein